jgi:hypothetical protein
LVGAHLLSQLGQLGGQGPHVVVSFDVVFAGSGVLQPAASLQHDDRHEHRPREVADGPVPRSLEVFTDAWKRSFTEPADEKQIMRVLIGDLYDNLRTHDEAVTGLLTAQDSLDPETTADIERLFADVFAQLRVMGEHEADRRDWFSGEGMDLNARLLVGMVTATVAYRRWFMPTGRNRISRERLVTHMTNLMLYGLRLAPPNGELPTSSI